MKCPNCGQWNRQSLPRCMKCGEPLEAAAGAPAWRAELHDDQRGKEYIRVDEFGDAAAVPDERDVLAQEMHDLKERKSTGTTRLRRLRENSAERGAAPSAAPIRLEPELDNVFHMNDDPRSTVRIVRDGVQQPSAQPAKEMPIDTWQTGTYDPLVDDFNSRNRTYREDYPFSETSVIRFKPRYQGLRRLIRVLTVLLMLSVTGLCIFFGIAYFRDHRVESSQQSRASVTASIMDDLAAHTILIPGEDGQQIYITELHTSYIVTGGFATVEVPDHIWYDELGLISEETMTVSLTPYIKTASGQQRPMDPISYEIAIPLSPITLLTPDSTRHEVATAMYSMSFNVRVGSTVYINGEDVSDTVNAETGVLIYNATVQPIGDNVFDIRVQSQYCRENRISITLYREPQEIPLDLSPDTYATTTLSAIEIRATTLPGVDVTVLSPHSDLKITDLDTTGSFSFMAVFDHYGYNDIIIEASSPGKKTSRVVYQMYFVDKPEVYTPKAWSLNDSANYSELISNISVRAARSQVYVAKGQVAQIINEKPQRVLVYCSDDGVSRPVLLENQTTVTWQVGETYRFYADAYSTYDSMPWLITRYCYSD